MGWSMDCLDYCHERNAIPLHCWQDVCMSKIWIPVNLLPNRTRDDNQRATQGIYHTLERKDFSRYNQSFSVYSDTEDRTEQEEIFISDSDNDSTNDIFNSGSLEKIEMRDSTILPLNYADNHEEKVKNDNSNKKSKLNDINFNREERVIPQNERSHLGACEKFSNDEKTLQIFSAKENCLNTQKPEKEDYNIRVNDLSRISNSESQNNMSSLKAINDTNFRDTEGGMSLTFSEAKKDASSHISLNEILDETVDINMKNFPKDFKFGDRLNSLSVPNEGLTSLFVPDEGKKGGCKSKKNKDKKVKKKPPKCIALDKFLENVVDNSQEYYCEKYFQSLFNDENRNFQSGNLPIRSETEFPDLVSDELKFVHSSKKKEEKNPELNFKCLTRQLEKSDEVNNQEKINDNKEFELTTSDSPKWEKLVVENIPCEVSEDDILLILCGYGEIKNISFITEGKFLKAFIEIDLICDTDWIIECLNGSEPFGTSSGVLKCYKQS